MAELGPADLRSMAAFAPPTDADLVAIARATTLEHIAPGEILIAHGMVSDQVHLVLSGTLTAELPTAGGARRVVEFGAGDIIGVPIPFLGVTTDLTHWTVAIHGRGDLVRVLRASAALLGVIPLPVPSLATTAVRSMLVTSVRARQDALVADTADLYLQLSPLPCALLEFDTVREVAEAGYQAAREPITAFALERFGRTRTG